MRGINKVTIVGNLGRDPEVRHTTDGSPIVTLSVATSEEWTDKRSGEKRQSTEWHRVVIFNPGLAKVAADYLKKGDKVYLEGKLQTRKWIDQNNQDRYSTEVVIQPYRGEFEMLGGGRGWDEQDQNPDQSDHQQPDTPAGETTPASHGDGVGEPNGSVADLDDEIPF